MFDFLNISKALSDESRVRILLALTHRELCVCQITGILDLAPSTTSKHLSILKQARLIDSRKKGKWVYYSLANIEGFSDSSNQLISRSLSWVIDSVKDSPKVLDDFNRMVHICNSASYNCGAEFDNEDNFHSLEIHFLEEAE